MLTTLKLEGDVNHIIQARWMKWRSVSRIICDRKVLLKLKGKFYCITTRLVMLYCIECWVIKRQQELYGIECVAVKSQQEHRDSRALSDEKMVEFHLMLFDQVRRRPLEALIRIEIKCRIA